MGNGVGLRGSQSCTLYEEKKKRGKKRKKIRRYILVSAHCCASARPWEALLRDRGYHMFRCDGRPSGTSLGSVQGRGRPPATQGKDSRMCEGEVAGCLQSLPDSLGSSTFSPSSSPSCAAPANYCLHLAEEHDALSPSTRVSYAAVSFPLCCLRLCLPRTDILCPEATSPTSQRNAPQEVALSAPCVRACV